MFSLPLSLFLALFLKVQVNDPFLLTFLNTYTIIILIYSVGSLLPSENDVLITFLSLSYTRRLFALFCSKKIAISGAAQRVVRIIRKNTLHTTEFSLIFDLILIYISAYANFFKYFFIDKITLTIAVDLNRRIIFIGNS